MSITVKLMGDLNRFTESATVALEAGPRSLGEVMDELLRRYPPLRSRLFDDRGSIRDSLLLVVQGRSLKWLGDEDSIIEDGGELLLMRFLAGG